MWSNDVDNDDDIFVWQQIKQKNPIYNKLILGSSSSSIGPPNLDNYPEDGKIKSEIIIKDNRRYFLDLKENTRGRFLRVWRWFKLCFFYWHFVIVSQSGFTIIYTWWNTNTDCYSSTRNDWISWCPYRSTWWIWYRRRRLVENEFLKMFLKCSIFLRFFWNRISRYIAGRNEFSCWK